MFCHLQPPHNPKYSHSCSILFGEGKINFSIFPSRKSFLFLKTLTFTISPGTPFSIKIILPSSVFPTDFPLLVVSIISTSS